MNSNFVFWIDLETTGTDEDFDHILEVGAVLTGPGPAYPEIETFHFVTGELTPARLWRMNDTVTMMHAQSGLLSEGKQGGPSISQVDEEIHTVLKQYAGSEHIPCAGSGVSHFDRRFIKRYMPKTSRHLTYWNLDVGELRRSLREAGFAIADSGNLNHRALDDIRAHIEERRLYLLALDELRGAQLNHPESECAEGGYCPAHRLLMPLEVAA